MKGYILAVTIFSLIYTLKTEEVRLINLDPPEAQQVINQQDQSLDYAPKVESNVPAVRYLGNEPHDVQEDIYLARQYHGQDGIGGYLYGYNIPDIAKTEKKIAGGDLRGAYNYKNGEQEIKVEYWDDGTGFHQIDNVPQILPKQIEDLPEVKAEKDKFFARWHEEAERNQHPVTEPYDSNGNYASGPLSPQGQIEFQKQFGSQYSPGSTYQYNQGQQIPQLPDQYQNSGSNQQSVFVQPGYGNNPNQYGQGYQKPVDNVGQYSQNQNVYTPSGQSGSEPYGSGAASSGSSSLYSQYGSGSTGSSPQYQQSSSNPNIQYHQSESSGSYGQYGDTPSGTYSSGSASNSGSQYQQSGAYGQHSSSDSSTGSYGSASNYYQNTASTSGSGYNQGGQYTKNNDVSDSGEYNAKYEEENGPPKGFFYKFDYPVGKIVSVGGIARSASTNNPSYTGHVN